MENDHAFNWDCLHCRRLFMAMPRDERRKVVDDYGAEVEHTISEAGYIAGAVASWRRILSQAVLELRGYGVNVRVEEEGNANDQ